MVFSIEELDSRRAMLDERHGPWRPVTVSGALDRVVATHPDRPFVIGEHTSFSYRELAEFSTRLARGLVARGIEAGDRVAIVLPNGPEAVAVRFAVARAGAVAVPISFQLRARELAYVLEQSRSVALITMEAFRGIDALDALDRIAPGWE
ncbi:MAG: AMP-binding protein, partial [Sciscionella sp.]